MEKINISNIRDEYITKTTYGNGITGNVARTEDVKLLAEKINQIVDKVNEHEKMFSLTADIMSDLKDISKLK